MATNSELLEMLKHLGIDFEKVLKHIPAMYWDKIYFSEEAAKKAGTKYYAVIDVKNDSYYVSNPISTYDSLVNGKIIKSEDDKTLIDVTDALGETHKVQKWFHENVVKLISEGKDIVYAKSMFLVGEREAIKNKIKTRRPEFETNEFCFVNSFPSNFDESEYFVYNTKLDSVGTGASYINDKLNFFTFNHKKITEISKNGTVERINDRISASELTGIKCFFMEAIENLVSVKTELETKEKIILCANTKESEARTVSIPFSELKKYVSLWKFNNLVIADRLGGSYFPETQHKNKTHGHVDIILDDKQNLVAVHNYGRNGLGSSNHLVKPALSGGYTSYYTANSVKITETEAENLRKEEIELKDFFDVKASIPKWMYDELLSKEEEIVFYTSETYHEVFAKVKEKLIGKNFVAINIGHPKSKDNISFSRYENISKDTLFNNSVSGIPNLKDPTEIKYLLFDKRKTEPEICVFGHQTFGTHNTQSVDEQYKYIVKQYNQKTIKLKQKESFQKEVTSYLKEHPKTKTKSLFIYSSKEEYLQNKSRLEEISAPIAIWFKDETTIEYDTNAAYPTVPGQFPPVAIKQKELLPDLIESRYSQYECIDDYYYRYKPLYKILQEVIEPYKSLIQLRVTPAALPNTLQYNSSTELVLQGIELGNLHRFDSNKASGTLKDEIKSHLEKTYEKYFTRKDNPPAILKTLIEENDGFKVFEQFIETVSQKDFNRRALDPYKLFCIEDSVVVNLVDEYSECHSFNLTDETKVKELHSILSSMKTKLLKEEERGKELRDRFKELIKSVGGQTIKRGEDVIYDSFFTDFALTEKLSSSSSVNDLIEQSLTKTYEAIEDTVNILKDEGEFLFLSKKFAKEFPEAFLELYFVESGEQYDNFNHRVGEYSYGMCFESSKGIYTLFDRNGKPAFSFSKSEMLSSNNDKVVEYLRSYFKKWEEEHLYLEDKHLYLPKKYDFIIKDPKLNKLVMYDTDISSSEKDSLPKDRIEVSYNEIAFYARGILYGKEAFAYATDDESIDIEDFKSCISPLLKVAEIAKSDAQIVARRLVAKNIKDLTTKILLALAKTKKDIPAIEKFLETSQGQAIVGLVSSLILKTSISYFDSKYRNIIEEISTEMRIASETDLALGAVDFIQETFERGLLSNHPELVRVAVESFDQTKEKEDFGSEDYSIIEQRSQSPKMVN